MRSLGEQILEALLHAQSEVVARVYDHENWLSRRCTIDCEFRVMGNSVIIYTLDDDFLYAVGKFGSSPGHIKKIAKSPVASQHLKDMKREWKLWDVSDEEFFQRSLIEDLSDFDAQCMRSIAIELRRLCELHLYFVNVKVGEFADD